MGEGSAAVGDRWRVAAERLLPEAPRSDLPRGRLAFGFVVAFLGAVGFQLLMPAGWSRLQRVWAEDGARFLLDGITQPFATNLVSPYGGYLHTIPRLAAELVSVLPLEWAATGFAVLAAVPRALVALVVFAASAGHLRSLPVRFAHAALVVVLPVGNSEPLDNVTNLHWFLLYGVFWALLWRREPRVPVAVVVFVVLATLSSPLVVLLIPVALLRLALRRDLALPVAFLGAAAVQAVVMVFAERNPYSRDPVDPVQVVLAALLRVPVAAFTGSEQVERYYPALGNAPVLVTLVLVCLPVLAGLRWGGRPGRLLVALGLGYSVLVIVVTLTTNWGQELQVQQPGVVLAAQRYSIAPCLFLFAAVAVGLDAVPRETWARLAVKTGQVVFALVVFWSVVQHVHARGGVLEGLPWGDSVARAREQCAAGGPVGRFEHQPDGWFFHVPCAYLGR
ncbi:hypothetical protein Q5530_08350 [Saccharothrix sp. BKS2]|uniref:hypothetical protein n=1 Tax=Saccharothrix sp. BKS2 TaxID=3064400 RepID=UPI0039E9D99A